MEKLVEVKHLFKSYGAEHVLNDVNFDIERGRIYGLIGHNGAGKTTILNAVLGLIDYQGEIKLLGEDPYQNRAKLMEQVAFISDVASLPRFLKVSQLISMVNDIHPKFNEEKIHEYLQNSNIKLQTKIKSLSKGMLAQLHLALVMAIDAQILVLDEPTLGLDILNRKQFFKNLLEDYMHDERTIIITTHQVDEIENLLSDILFVQNGHIVLNSEMDAVGERYLQLNCDQSTADELAKFNPIYQESHFGQYVMIFKDVHQADLEAYGSVSTPSLSDLFVALMS